MSALGPRLARGLDGWLTTVGALGTTLAHRRAWRLGLALQAGAARTLEAVRRSEPVRSWAWAGPRELEAALRADPTDPPPYPGFARPAPGIPAQAAALARGELLVGDGACPVQSLSWLRDPFGDASSLARLRYHALEPVEDLLRAHAEAPAGGFLALGRTLAERWIQECLDVEDWRNLWSDHGTALRAIVLCRLWAACRRSEPLPGPFLGRLLQAIARHGDKLAHPRLYRPDHNHGVTQAYALLAIGLGFPSLPAAGRWARLARERLEAQLADNVSPDGLHLEHSPYYHLYVLQHFLLAERLARAHGVTFSEAFRRGTEAMLAAGAHLLKPDGTLACLGDTARDQDPLVGPDDAAGRGPAGDAYVYSVTRGARGTPSRERCALYRGGGLAVLRSGWGEREPLRDERCVVLRLSTCRTSHVHRDALSFELYGYGRDLVVDSGGPFRYRHPLRGAYFTATRAHNTVVVDDRDQAIGPATLLDWRGDEAWHGVAASHRGYAGVEHRRALVLLRPRYLLVLDLLDSAGEHRYAQVFHLAPGLPARLDGLRVLAGGDGEAGARIVPLVGDGLEPRLVRGASDPPQGWVTRSEAHLEPAPVVEYRRTGRRAVFAALVVADPPGGRAPVEAALTGTPFADEMRIRIEAPDLSGAVTLGPSGRLGFRGRSAR